MWKNDVTSVPTWKFSSFQTFGPSFQPVIVNPLYSFTSLTSSVLFGSLLPFRVFVYSVKQLFHDLPSFSPLTLKSDRDLIASYSITAKSNIKVVRVEKMIADLRCSW